MGIYYLRRIKGVIVGVTGILPFAKVLDRTRYSLTVVGVDALSAKPAFKFSHVVNVANAALKCNDLCAAREAALKPAALRVGTDGKAAHHTDKEWEREGVTPSHNSSYALLNPSPPRVSPLRPRA